MSIRSDRFPLLIETGTELLNWGWMQHCRYSLIRSRSGRRSDEIRGKQHHTSGLVWMGASPCVRMRSSCLWLSLRVQTNEPLVYFFQVFYCMLQINEPKPIVLPTGCLESLRVPPFGGVANTPIFDFSFSARIALG